MVRDTTNQTNAHRQEWESLPKTGQGSEFGREAKEQARRRRFTMFTKKGAAEELPWIITSKGNDKEKTKDKQYDF